MAKVILEPIGSNIDEQDSSYMENVKQIKILEDKLDRKRLKLKKGWGRKYQKRVEEKGKLTTWKRIERLIDKKSEIFPIQSFVNDSVNFGDKSKRITSPSAGVITAFVKVNNIFVIVIANDNTVASGSWWPKTPEKIIRAQEIALKIKIPVIYLIDCSGLFLQEQSLSFPGQRGAGHIFKMNSMLSNSGIAQIAGVMGDCIAGGGYMPIISDKVFMTEKAYMVIAGAALIKGAKNKKLSSLDIGGSNIHVNISNCADIRVPDDQTCIDQIREEVKKLPSSAAEYYKSSDLKTTAPKYKEKLSGLIPVSYGKNYNIMDVLARIIDESLFWEIMPERGKEVVVGVARINGLYVGIASNRQELTDHPSNIKEKRAGSILYNDGVKKLSIFSRACNDDGLPIVWIQDVAGFDVGEEAEKQGLLGYGSNLIYSNSTNTTPMISILLRKASGAGYYAMSGLPYDPILQLSTVISRLAVMDGKTLAIGAFNTKLDENYKIKSTNLDEINKIKLNMMKIEEKIENDMNPYKSASQMDTDEIIKMEELRSYLGCIIECCYQNHGYRRIKNPRIWCMHDINIG